MGLQKLHNVFVDYSKISYIGKMDSHVKAHIGVVIHFFEIIVEGRLVEVSDHDKEEVLRVRNRLVDTLTRVEGYLPG